MTEQRAKRSSIVVTGASGYVGGRLVPALLDAGYRVRCIAREPRKLDERSWRSHPAVTVDRGDLSDAAILTRQLDDCEAAFYLVHSMEGSGKAYAERDRDLARTFAESAAAAHVGRIVYLGGLGELGSGLSEHLSSRREVERVLASTGVPVTVFRAAMIIGSGSASFEILRYLVERLPIMVTPVSYRIARPLAEGLRNRVVVTDDTVQRLMPHPVMGVREAIRKALDRARSNTVHTRWSVAGPVPGDPEWAGGTQFEDERSIIIRAKPEQVFQAVCRIGGGHGWYAGDEVLPEDTTLVTTTTVARGPAETSGLTYGRARLWLGISCVGTLVTLASLALALGLPARASGLVGPALPDQILLLLAFFLTYAAVQLPFDFLGGYVLPRRFARDHPPAMRFAGRLLRGVVAHTLLLTLIAAGLLLAGRTLGVWGVVVASAVMSLLLLAVRSPLARIFAPLRAAPSAATAVVPPENHFPTEFVESDDEGFTGGLVGVLRPRRAILPHRWVGMLGSDGLKVVARRRRLAIGTGSWIRGRMLSLSFTLFGVILAAQLTGSTRIGSGEGIISFSLLFTIWSFIGLLLLPTPSRAGVAEIDAALRRSGLDPDLIDGTIQRLDALQDAEPERPACVDTFFHPIPSVRSRTEGPTRGNTRGFLDAARSSVFLSAAGLGLLGRAVHCNCGRPGLWAFLPSD